jgi:phosphoserine phosphatase
VKNTLVLIANSARPALDEALVQAAAETLRAGGAAVGRPDWLAPAIACDLPFDGPASQVMLPKVDAVVVPTEGRRKKLLVADMESTMIANEMLDELAEFLGLREKIAAITARAMNGEIDFAGALEERVSLLKGLPVGKLDEAARRIRYTPGGATLVATMKEYGAFCALVSGGFTYFTGPVRDKLGFELDVANMLQHDGKALSGTVEPPILGKEAKLATLRRLAEERTPRGWVSRFAPNPPSRRKCRPGSITAT